MGLLSIDPTMAKKTKKTQSKGFEIKTDDSTKKADELAKKKKGGKGAAATGKPSASALFAPRPRIFGIGQDLPPKRELNRFVKWPKYIRLQRQRRILYKRLKVPPSINQFNQTLDKNTAAQLLRLASKYAPETKEAKRARLQAAAKAKVEGAATEAPKKPYQLKSGLCQLVGQKTATAVAFTSIAPADKNDFATLLEAVNDNFSKRYAKVMKTWGGGQLSARSNAAMSKKLKAIAAAQTVKA